uniref:MIF4G domain-containing protein n=1 Tax=Pyrodinium bahamense TaxID=73915 RepID=A0A7S0AGR5_9DINO|mmetsp:Transcript_33197/g.91835  ORF Transcript_33197/g.91835 Transcript_33197/m.91835 type:complete len:700 (+) Transcript_33197:90-2189(+)
MRQQADLVDPTCTDLRRLQRLLSSKPSDSPSDEPRRQSAGSSQATPRAGEPTNGAGSTQSWNKLQHWSEERLSRMLAARAGSGVVAKIIAKRSPGSLRLRADHSTFSALNLDGVAGPRASGRMAPTSQIRTGAVATPAKPSGKDCTPTGAVALVGVDEATSAGSEWGGESASSVCWGMQTAEQAGGQDRASLLVKGTFEEVRDFLMSFRTCCENENVPSELRTLVMTDASHRSHRVAPALTPQGEGVPPSGVQRSPVASPVVEHPDVHRSISGRARQTSQESDGGDVLSTPFGRMRCAQSDGGDALSIPFGRMRSGQSDVCDALSLPFGRMRSAQSDGGDALSIPFGRMRTRESDGGDSSVSAPFARLRTISCSPLDELRRTMQSLLNKVCPENMVTIADKITAIKVTSPDELEVIIELIFQKALAEPHYCETYADLIFCLRSAFPEFPTTDGSRPITFRSSLLNVCQNEFESLPATLTPSEEERSVLDEEELELSRKRRKDRMLANIRLIGHIFLRQLLPAKVITAVLMELVPCKLDGPFPEEHTLECACEMLMSTGHTLESLPTGTHVVQQVCGYLLELKGWKAANGKSACSKRVQFLIQDMLDARSAGWAKKSFKSSAKTKEEVRMEQERDISAQMQGERSPQAERTIAGQRPVYLSSARAEQEHDASPQAHGDGSPQAEKAAAGQLVCLSTAQGG